MRALVVAMEAWIGEGGEPPASVYPGLEGGTLVEPDALDLPRMAGTVPEPVVNALRVMDHASTPPEPGEAYPVLVPATDADGIDLGGIRQPHVAAPLGTYLGWNLRDEGFAPGELWELCSLTGSFIPFPETEGEADGRRPVAARYDGSDGYAEAVRRAAEELAGRGLMRPDDVGLVVDAAPAFPNAAE